MKNELFFAARKKRRWTHEKISELAGISVVTISRWENGLQQPRDSTLDLVCNAFKMTPAELGFEETIEEKDAGPESRDDMDAKRRTLLTGAASIMIAPSFLDPDILKRLSGPVSKPTMSNSALRGFDKATEACWDLSNGNELAIAEQMMSSYLPKLAKLVREPSSQQHKAASLLSENLQLNSILAAHKLDFTAKEIYCLHAIDYARQAGDHNAQASAMVQLAVAYYYQAKKEKALEVYQDALLFVSLLSPLMQSRVYIGAAEAYGKNGLKQEALRYLGLAYQTFPEDSERDPSYRYADFGLFALVEHDGLVNLSIGQSRKALEIFIQAEKHPAIPERIRLEVVNYQAASSLSMSNYSGLLETLSRKRKNRRIAL
jgi:transcriptional regulator with XRE-family HTH domain